MTRSPDNQTCRTRPVVGRPVSGRKKVGGVALAGALSLCLALPAGASYRDGGVFRAKVLSSQPIIEQVEVAVPREVCRDERVREAGRYYSDYRGSDGRGTSRARSRTPGIVGAIVGGALGHSVGHGKKNKKIGTAVGAILGGSIGADISRRNHERQGDYREPVRRVTYRTERVCEVQRDYRTEEHISGYDVTYAYGGETYSAVLDRDPGRYLDVSVRVTPAD